jgi:hypothetical protein
MIVYILEAIFWYLVFALTKQKRKNEEWAGILEDKRLKSSSIAKHFHILVFRKEDGKKVKFRVKAEDFARYEQGKRYLKRSGEFLPDPGTTFDVSGRF